MTKKNTRPQLPAVQGLEPASKVGSGTASFASLTDMLSRYAVEEKPAYITQEFQDYGYRLAVALDDLSHKSLYIKMAKRMPRGLLEQALSYVADAAAVKSKARLFMWKLQQLEHELENKRELKQSTTIGAQEELF